MAKLSHSIEYVLALAGAKAAQTLSPRLADRFGAGIGSLVHTVWPSRRRIAHENLRLAMGDALSPSERTVVVKQVFRNIGRTLVEMSRFGSLSPDRVLKITSGNGLDYVAEAREKGQGAVIATAHFGNWELLGCWFGCHGYPIDFLIGTQHNAKVDNMMIAWRREMGVGIIPARSGVRNVFKALRGNRLVGLVNDQHTAAGAPIDFFGRKAYAAKGAAAFAVKVGCPVLPFLMRRERHDRHVVMAGEPLYPSESGDKDTEVHRITAACNEFFEEGIRAYPDQWMWTHRRWKAG